MAGGRKIHRTTGGRQFARLDARFRRFPFLSRNARHVTVSVRGSDQNATPRRTWFDFDVLLGTKRHCNMAWPVRSGFFGANVTGLYRRELAGVTPKGR
jgi:hypothetical protein